MDAARCGRASCAKLSAMEELTLEQKVRLLTGADFWSLHAEPADRAAPDRRRPTAPPGVRGERWDERDPSANVPSPTALAATWDAARIERARPAAGRRGAAQGRRRAARADGQPAPDARTAAATSSASARTRCSPRGSAPPTCAGCRPAGSRATVKHFVANDSETERFTLDARVDERALRELYLAPFEAIVREAGAVGGDGRLQRRQRRRR